MKKFYYTSILLLWAIPLSVMHAAGGSLYISPGDGIYRVDEPYVIEVLANTDGEKINAVEAEIAYNPRDFTVDRVSVDQSILTTWSTTPAFDGAAGIIKFSGWTSQPYVGKQGRLITVTLRPLRVAQSSLVFNSGAMLAADGHGSNILTIMTPGSYSVSPKQVVSVEPVGAVLEQSQVVSTTPSQTADVVEQPLTVLNEPSNQVAALVASGFELAPIVAIFFGLLVVIAFCIAYLLHRKERRHL